MSSPRVIPVRLRWSLDPSVRHPSTLSDNIRSSIQLSSSTSDQGGLPPPPGWSPHVVAGGSSGGDGGSGGAGGSRSSVDGAALIVKRSWEIALAPIKQLPMNLFIMFMAGNSISIFPIMMVGMMVFSPLKALFAIQSTFSRIEGAQAPLQRFVYFLGNILGIALALYKLHGMGLLPTYASDWLAFQDQLTPVQWVGGGGKLV